MVQILQAGTGAQEVLLRHVRDQTIQDQILMLLGGIGNERAIWPIIETLTDGNEAANDARSNRLNLVGNLPHKSDRRPCDLASWWWTLTGPVPGQAKIMLVAVVARS
jgi:hypothetical protein